MSNSTGNVNSILMVIIALMVGAIGGYFIGQSSGGGATVAGTAAQATTANCPHSLDVKDQWILAELRCPGSDAAQVLLLECHCPTAHGVMDKVKSELAAGKSGETIRQEIIAEYGDRLKFLNQ